MKLEGFKDKEIWFITDKWTTRITMHRIKSEQRSYLNGRTKKDLKLLKPRN